MTASNNFRDLLFPLDSPRLGMARDLSARQFGEAILAIPPARAMIDNWRRLAEQPYRGITSNGEVEMGLFALADEQAPVGAMVDAAETLMRGLSDGERSALCYAIDAEEWRHWSNPEFLINPNGLRMEELSGPTRDNILGILRASLSATGYEKARGCMFTNAFLGDLCGLPNIMNEWSYNFLIFGTPSRTEPWGWSLYGHHLVLNCFVRGGQMVISPTFMGAEPNYIDAGPHAGLRLFDIEESGGLELMRSLPIDLQSRAQIYPVMGPAGLPDDRWAPGDQRHLGGAFHDNRVVPFEGVPASELSLAQRDKLLEVIGAFIAYLPPEPFAARMRQIEGELDRTFWSWIGGFGDEDPFYYRVQSPLIMVEFDHHSGVWLANETPAKCHIHTVVRTPNGNDYGKDLLRQHYADVHPGCTPGHA